MPIKMLPLPPIERLRELFDLDVETGALTWRTRPASHFKHGDIHHSAAQKAASRNARFAGKRAGTIIADGRRMVRIDRLPYIVSRIVYALAFGADPGESEVDHRDRDPSNDRPDNLRLATRSTNCHNQGRRRDNQTGLRGVSFDRRAKKFRGEISFVGRRKSLCYFVTAADAYAAYYAAKIAAAEEFAPLDLPPPNGLMARALARLADETFRRAARN